MGFGFVLFLGVFFFLLVQAVNKKLNNPGDSPFGGSTTDHTTQKEDDDFPPIEPSEPTRPQWSSQPEPTQEAEEPVEAEQTFEPEPEELETVIEPEPAKGSYTVSADDLKYDRLFGLIGKPLGHSASKARFNKFFNENGMSAYYENYELESIEQLDSLTSNPKLCGFNVTIPYKQDIIPYLTRLDETAQAIGAVNTVKVLHVDGKTELVGYNTDWIGFTVSFKELLEGHKKALILGTGGVSQAVKYALEQLGLETRFVSRNSTFDIMGYYELSPSVMDDFDVIVNCTPLGMWPNVDQAPDIPYGFISDKHLLLDVIANPDETLFMKKGREHGAQAKGGKDMLEQQAVAAWNIWNE